tara:strand:+ start:278 stop:745 length:468 start_codon:yes stop_codon:yes gene_type:complete
VLDVLNQYQELDLVESKINDDGSLCLVVAQAHTPDALNFENDAVIGNKNAQDLMQEIMHAERVAEVTSQSAIYEISFEEFITYSVTSEGFLAPLNPTEVNEPYGVFEASAFIAYVKATTDSDSEFQEPFKHYAFDCVNFRVDVAATVSPSIRQVQ